MECMACGHVFREDQAPLTKDGGHRCPKCGKLGLKYRMDLRRETLPETGLDRFLYTGGPEKPKEPAPLTHLKVGDVVHIEIGNWRELGDYAKVISVDGEQITVEGIESGHQGRKTFNERHFLTFSMGWGDHPGGREKYPGEYYFFHFAMVPPDDVLAFGLRKYEATGSEEYRKYAHLFSYYAPEAEFKPKARDFDEALLRHHFYSPHGVNIEELFRGVKPLPRKAWELKDLSPAARNLLRTRTGYRCARKVGAA